MAILCISVPGSERQPAFAGLAQRQGLKFAFANAVTPADIQAGKTPAGCRVDLSDLRWTILEQAHPRRQQSPMLFTELAVTYSHIGCWQWALQMNLDHLVVFEDDAEILRPLSEEDFAGSWDFKYLSDRMPADGRGFAAGIGTGADGYCVSRTGLMKLIKIFAVIYMPVDTQIITHTRSQIEWGHPLTDYRRKDIPDYYLNARVASVPVCKHGSFPSTIG